MEQLLVLSRCRKSFLTPKITLYYKVCLLNAVKSNSTGSKNLINKIPTITDG